ncbi:hypothetical protein ScPMuIL_012117 [Solemya velum]
MAAPIVSKHVVLTPQYFNFVRHCPRFIHSKTTTAQEKKEKYAACPERVFSGIQPTGVPHIGNYIGAIRSWVQLQQSQCEVIYSIVDLHSITVPQEPDVLRENIFSMTACLLACGIDPDKSILFQQSSVPQHSELSWILGCLCSIPRLQHLPQWKEKSKRYKDASVGLFTYPILQAADILLYKSTKVPVGYDQTHHIELSAHLARAFNRSFGVVFPRPVILSGEVTKIRSLRKPQNKMSKSESDSYGRIDLTDPPDLIREKLKKAVTDSMSSVSYDLIGRPGVSNLIDIHCALTGLLEEEVCRQCEGTDTGRYKGQLADVVIETLQPIQAEIKQLLSDKPYLLQILSKGQQKATDIAEKTLSEVKKLVGFRS